MEPPGLASGEPEDRLRDIREPPSPHFAPFNAGYGATAPVPLKSLDFLASFCVATPAVAETRSRMAAPLAPSMRATKSSHPASRHCVHAHDFAASKREKRSRYP